MRGAQRTRRVLGQGAVLQLPEHRLTWNEAVDLFIGDKRLDGRARQTIRNYEWVLKGRAKEFAAEQGFTTIEQWDAEAFRRFKAALAGVDPPLSLSALSIHHRTMKTFLRFCLERHYLSDPQVLMVKGPKIPEQHPRGLSQDEERKLLAAAKRLGERDRMLVELLLRTGLRPQEAARLTIDDLQETVNGVWLIRVYGKGDKERIIPLDTPHHALSETLRNYLRKERPKDTRRREMFLTKRHTGPDGDYAPMTSNGIAKLFGRIADRAGVQAHAYRCRHTFAMRSLAARLDHEALRKAMGHTTYRMTMRYLTATEEDLIAAYQRRTD
ncbi:MAG TPA: tyrosine-type recombinase/integrase [Candidatus Dormibacteraeota bacterium]|jgi:site-specific recombinase XerD